MSLIVKSPRPSGGKAGKGRNRTTNWQVFDTDTNCIIKQFSYKVGDYKSRYVALQRAKDFISKWDN